MSTPLLKKYISFQTELDSIYGKNNCAVLIMNGSFYNIYEFNTPQLQIGSASKVSQILNIILTKNSKKKPHSLSNPIMCGVQVETVSRHLATLISNNMTIAIYNQIDNDSDPKEHSLYKIFSPSTHLDNISNNNTLLSIITNNYTCIIHGHKLHSIHLSYIDLSTGNNFLIEHYDLQNINSYISKYIQSINPSEIISNIKNYDFNVLHHSLPNKPEYKNNVYQETFLNKIFPNKSLLSIFEYLQLDNKPDLTLSYLHLLQFAYDHDPLIISKINKPSLEIIQTHLTLNSDAQIELNIFNKDKPSIFSIINKTNTKFGERRLKYRLFHPIYCVDTLNKRYNNISYFIDKHKDIKKQLSNILDIEKYIRRLYIYSLQPHSFANLNNSFNLINTILHTHINNFHITQKTINNWNSFYSYYTHHFNIDIMSESSDFKSSFFNIGIFPEIDTLNTKINDIKKSFNHIATLLENDKGVGVHLQNDQTFKTTKRAWNSIKDETRQIKFKIGNDEMVCKLSDFINVENNTKTYVRLECNIVKKLHNLLYNYENKISSLIKQAYNNISDHIQSTFGQTIKNIINIISEIDISVCGAQVSTCLNYTKPTIYNVDKSFIKAKKIRHPIIEQINDNHKYIPNDINLDNLLLFGLNSSGKSSLLRSIGCNVILAQIGFFVASSSFEFSPFKNLISKISNNDDLYKGQSTFISEMNELKNILENSDNRTLVLCDELTSGTETNSSVGIVCSTILSLLKLDCCFLFTTHLHEILHFDEISDNKDLVIKHFKVKMEDGKIGFDRKLREGSGDCNYGIEIANYLDISPTFIKMCHNFRNRFVGNSLNILDNKRSRYNTKVIMDRCSICGERENLHTHHIREQNEANDDGMIEHFHKNRKFNLMVVCEKCHQKIHNN
jgi:DNA mismatch repair protein MutS